MFDSAIFLVFSLSSSLIAAVVLYDLYRRQKKHSDHEKENLDLVCYLAKVSFQMTHMHDQVSTIVLLITFLRSSHLR